MLSKGQSAQHAGIGPFAGDKSAHLTPLSYHPPSVRVSPRVFVRHVQHSHQSICDNHYCEYSDNITHNVAVCVCTQKKLDNWPRTDECTALA
jgi:hypothetical protein